MKRKINIVFISIIILGLGAYLTWSYLNSIDGSTFSGVVMSLKHYGYNVKDVTTQYSKNYPSKYSGNEKVLNINGEEVFITIEKSKNIEEKLRKELAACTNPLAIFKSIPHLYRKGNLIITYVGRDEKLLEILNELFGEDLVPN